MPYAGPVFRGERGTISVTGRNCLGKGVFRGVRKRRGEIRNGSDLPRIARATKILELARAYGIKVSAFDDESVHMPAPSDTYHY